MKFKDYVDSPKKGEFVYNSVGGGKFRTQMPLNKRSLKNIPKYANGRNRVKFEDWLHIKKEKDGYYGRSDANGKWYGWSHRAVYGFKSGDKVTGDSLGKKVLDWDNGKYEPDFTIKNDDHAKQVAKTFADNVG